MHILKPTLRGFNVVGGLLGAQPEINGSDAIISIKTIIVTIIPRLFFNCSSFYSLKLNYSWGS
jgi:hypothetical protein